LYIVLGSLPVFLFQLELARSFGKVMDETGWRPRRTIELHSWDAEEFGLVGSTEFGEVHREELKADAVAYINVDGACSGTSFRAAATPSLNDVLIDSAKDIIDPLSGEPLATVWNQDIGRLGSGSDYTVFIDHLGIASMDMGFSGGSGVYHSVYDSLAWMQKFGDPGFTYHTTMTQMVFLS
jgi:N-acetylated-alpha-linked acidic dipeptidase